MAIDLFSAYATDEQAEIDGVERDIGGGTKLLIARMNNLNYARALTASYEANREVLDMGGPAAEAKSKEVMVGALADAVLVGWSNVVYKGEALPYTKANARMVLGHGDFRTLVIRLAEERAAYQMKLEQAQGNG